MTTFYVIKNPIDKTYLSVEDNWTDFYKCKEFDSEESAIEELGKLGIGYFIIQKAYYL